MKFKKLQIMLFLFSTFLHLNIYASTYFVPSQYNTIQSAIDASSNGDTIFVSPGIYYEGINFQGKYILVKSTDGPEVTRIDAPALYAVTFDSGEDTHSILWGFSIGPEDKNTHSNWNGILCSSSSPTIVSNIIERFKRAIMVVKGSPIINRNIIREGIWFDNTSGIFIADTCSPVIANNLIFGYYQGIRISGSAPTIVFNTLDHNKYGIFGADSCIMKNNIITNGSYGILAVSSPRVVLSHNNVWNNMIQSIDLNYQNCSPGEGDISSDPKFLDNSLLELQTNSPCIDAGIDVEVYEDFHGNQRPSGHGFDIGAIEYISPSQVKLEQIIPYEINLSQNYPNPFNQSTSIEFTLNTNSHVFLVILDIQGRNVITLVDEIMDSRTHIVTWDGTNNHRNIVASGIYFCFLQASNQTKIIKIISLR